MPTKKYRCSRPLCSSQSAEDDRPPDTASPEQTRAVRHQNDLSPEETVARSLRTQQRAYNPPPHTIPFHAPPHPKT
jgi:hypothetical protein